MTAKNAHCNSADSSPNSFHRAECFTAAWISGLLTAFVFSGEVLFFAYSTGIALLGIVILSLIRENSSKQLVAWMMGILLSCAVWTVYDGTVRSPQLALDGQKVSISAKITDYRIYTGDTIRYTLRIKHDGVPMTVDWYADETTGRLQIGDIVRLNAEFTRISSDYLYKTAQSEAGRGKYVRIYDADVLEIKQHHGFSIKRALRDHRQTMTSLIRTRLDEDDAGLLLAMLFGDKNALSEETSAALYQTGIGHITAVSGLHLVFFCALLELLLRRYGASAKARFCACIVATLLFSAMVDSAVSVCRAAVMLLIARSAPLFGRRADALRSLCIAAVCCTVFTPYVIGSASFWLSISGVAGVAVFAPWMTAKIKLPRANSPLYGIVYIGRKMLSLLCVSIAVFPASVLFCGESSLLAPICNLVILPFSIAALCIGLLTVCTGGLTAFLLPIAGIFCRITTNLALLAAKLPFSHLRVSAKATQTVLMICVGIVAFTILFTKSRYKTVWMLVFSAILLSVEMSLDTIAARNQCRIALLGRKNQMVAMICADGYHIAADLSGSPRNAKYAAEYLTENNVSSPDFVLCSQKPAAGYDSAIPCAKNVILCDTDFLRSDTKICGCEPSHAEGSQTDISFADTTISYAGDRVTITWRGHTCVILPADETESVCAEAVVRYGGEPVTGDTCGIWSLPDVDGTRNSELIFTQTGDFELYPLT